MNIVFCFIDGGEDQEDFVKGKLMQLHYGHPNIMGAQVYFCREDGRPSSRCCQIDLTSYGQPLRVSETGTTFREAANRALTSLAEKIGNYAGSLAVN
jgi:hypothetical protein